uniref:Uncharacterized protein n=1 Tax=viral metagenome TaxID=1070528 RepID=A0A6C0DQ00_9ZZZZ
MNDDISIDEEWSMFLMSNGNPGSISRRGENDQKSDKNIDMKENIDMIAEVPPICDELYISTKTKVLFLNTPIDINTVFWNIPVIEYWRPQDGVVKKQMKIVSKTMEDFEEYKKRLETIPYYTENIIKQIDNPTARRIKFKDERKITIGISKKDIMNCRGKVKNAFYNCFALILRFKYNADFHEIHVKIFNTGKLEIPGILNSGLLDIVKKMIMDIMKKYMDESVHFVEKSDEADGNVLINSNFNCGYYIDRVALKTILRGDKYRIEAAYDPSSYPGLKCKYYFNNEIGFDEKKQTGQISLEDRGMKLSELGDNKKYTEVSFMIFRTGSCLIVGNCSERVLRFIYDFIKKLLHDEYSRICVKSIEIIEKVKKTKLRKKSVNMTQPYYQTNITSD